MKKILTQYVKAQVEKEVGNLKYTLLSDPLRKEESYFYVEYDCRVHFEEIQQENFEAFLNIPPENIFGMATERWENLTMQISVPEFLEWCVDNLKREDLNTVITWGNNLN